MYKGASVFIPGPRRHAVAKEKYPKKRQPKLPIICLK
jgi:hypothetical protein